MSAAAMVANGLRIIQTGRPYIEVCKFGAQTLSWWEFTSIRINRSIPQIPTPMRSTNIRYEMWTSAWIPDSRRGIIGGMETVVQASVRPEVTIPKGSTSGYTFWLVTFFLCVTVLLSVAAPNPNTPEPGTTTERFIASTHASFMLNEYLRVSPNSKRVAFAVKTNEKTAVILDGHIGKLYDSVASGFQFSSNSKTLAYEAQTVHGPAVVVNGKEVALSRIDGNSPR